MQNVANLNAIYHRRRRRRASVRAPAGGDAVHDLAEGQLSDLQAVVPELHDLEEQQTGPGLLSRTNCDSTGREAAFEPACIVLRNSIFSPKMRVSNVRSRK